MPTNSSFDFSATYVGVGMICPYIVNISLLLGSIISWGIMWPYIKTKQGDWYAADLPSSSLRGLQGYKVILFWYLLFSENASLSPIALCSIISKNTLVGVLYRLKELAPFFLFLLCVCALSSPVGHFFAWGKGKSKNQKCVTSFSWLAPWPWRWCTMWKERHQVCYMKSPIIVSTIVLLFVNELWSAYVLCFFGFLLSHLDMV